MGAFTTQILAGHSHTYDGGLINIHHSMYLSENSVARWLLTPFSSNGEPGESPVERLSWIPSPDTILEDGLLLLGLQVWKDEVLLKKAEEVFARPWYEVEMLGPQVIAQEDRLALHQLCRERLTGGKLVFTVMAGSSIMSQLDVLKSYLIEMEVCVSVYSKSCSPWTQQMEAYGSLSIPG
jgi:hypothetical protein